MYTNHIISVEEHAIWIASLAKNDQKKTFLAFFEGRLFGIFNIYDINLKQGYAKWGFYVDPVFQQITLGSALEFKILEFIFFELKLENLECEVFNTNNSVIRLHERFGFKKSTSKIQNLYRNDITPLILNVQNWNISREKIKKLFLI